ncbi:MAG TPA: hypothetical protein VLF66_10370 [Thermoanaerobaculia bacterium]|nr:hypothetical protein [Thermoanaerobaculia bacterium]
MADPTAAPAGRPGLPSPRADRAALAALALALCGAYLAAELYLLDGRLGFPLDDSWIHLAFGRSLAAGEGLAINPGEPVAGSTAPLWTALFALWVALPGSAVAWAKAAGSLLFAAVVLLAHGLARDLIGGPTREGGLGRGLALLAGGLTAATGWLVWSALSGMEIALFTALTLLGVRLHLRERREPARRPWSLAVLGLAVLARPEGALLVALALADRLLCFRRVPEPGAGDAALVWEPPDRRRLAAAGLGALAAAALVAPVAAYYAWIGGGPLPTTLAVKTGHDAGLHLPDLRYLHVAFGVLFRAQPWCAVLAPAGAVALLGRLGTGRDRGLLPALWVAGLPLAYSCLGGSPLVGNFGRYLFPLLPFVVVLGALALEPLATALAPGRERLRRALAALALAGLVGPAATELVRGAELYARNVHDIEEGDGAMVRWLAERLPPEALLGVVDLGYAAAELPNPILDLVGIASPEVSGFVRRARAEGRSWRDGVLEFVEERRPDYLMVFPDWLPAVAAPGSPFRPLHAVRVPGNITLGGDLIVLYSTPWTRYPLREEGR